MNILVYSEPFTGRQIIMEESRSYNKLMKELFRLIEVEDYPEHALYITNASTMDSDAENRAFKGFVIREGM
jgi:hypothetical protein